MATPVTAWDEKGNPVSPVKAWDAQGNPITSISSEATKPAIANASAPAAGAPGSQPMSTMFGPGLVRSATQALPLVAGVIPHLLDIPTGGISGAVGTGVLMGAGEAGKQWLDRAIFGKDEVDPISRKGLTQTGTAALLGTGLGSAENAISYFAPEARAARQEAMDWADSLAKTKAAKGRVMPLNLRTLGAKTDAEATSPLLMSPGGRAGAGVLPSTTHVVTPAEDAVLRTRESAAGVPEGATQSERAGYLHASGGKGEPTRVARMGYQAGREDVANEADTGARSPEQHARMQRYLKDEPPTVSGGSYKGPERRSNPFRDTEGVRQTIAQDKLMPTDVAARGRAAEMADKYPVRGGSLMSPNASGESAASQEAINKMAADRSKGIQHVIEDRAGRRTPAIGPRPEDNALNPGSKLIQIHPDGSEIQLRP